MLSVGRALSPLAVRVRSAAVLAPPVLLICYVGSLSFAALLVCAAAILAQEWTRLVGNGLDGQRDVLLLATTLVVALVAGAFAHWSLALVLLVVGSAVAWVASGGERWYAVGVLVLGMPLLALLALRAMPDSGRFLLFWMVATIWAFDTGAYLSGRAIGGPKLAPRVSPNKTWAGVLGGTLSAAAVGAIAAWIAGNAPVLPLSAASAAIGVVGQLGDLAESAIKRHFGVKDTGTLIPGHGGLLDRVDALLAASLVTAPLALLNKGTIATWLQ